MSTTGRMSLSLFYLLAELSCLSCWLLVLAVAYALRFVRHSRTLLHFLGYEMARQARQDASKDKKDNGFRGVVLRFLGTQMARQARQP
jgi:heme exporter protein D